MKNTLTILLFFIAQSALFSQSIPSYIPTNGLQAWWPFNNNANDESNQGHNGTVSSATPATDRFNNANASYSFNGGSYISVPDSINLRPASYAISAWAYYNATTGTRLILAKNVGSGTQESIGMYSNYNHLAGDISTLSQYGTLITCNNTNLQTNQWYHIIDQFDNVSKLHQIFLNGTLVYTVTETISIGYDTKPWTIGTEYENGSKNYFFSGKIDDIGIWNRTLNDKEISNIYNANTVVTGLKEYTSDALHVWPNPTSDYVHIDTKGSDVNYSVCDYTGKKLLTGTLSENNNRINLDNLASGLYLLQLNKASDEHAVTKLIKQ